MAASNIALGLGTSSLSLRRIGLYEKLRVLAWQGGVLHAGRGYEILRWRPSSSDWEPVARYHPQWWRSITSRNRLSSRLVRDGFHALAVANDGTLIAAVPHAIVSGRKGELSTTHSIQRGTRPLHITATPSGKIYWGEYFDNRERSEVHIYGSEDSGATWHVAHTFAAGAIRHVHNIVFDRWENCLWILTGDAGAECKVLRASPDLRSIETVLSGNQQARAVAAIPTRDALYLATDTPLEKNYAYRLERSGRLDRLTELNSSSIYGCRVGNNLFFSTMVEPSSVNTTRYVELIGCSDGQGWQTLQRWCKDSLPMHYFQYGNLLLPDGENDTRILAATAIAVDKEDLTTSLWEVV